MERKCPENKPQFKFLRMGYSEKSVDCAPTGNVVHWEKKMHRDLIKIIKYAKSLLKAPCLISGFISTRQKIDYHTWVVLTTYITNVNKSLIPKEKSKFDSFHPDKLLLAEKDA